MNLKTDNLSIDNDKLFHLEVINQQKELFNGECDFVVVPTTTGEIGILQGHIPLASIVSGGHIKIYIKGSLLKKIGTKSGFIEATHNHVNVLLSQV
jgi:F-type H+-transporting ATPase subunit epsilon